MRNNKGLTLVELLGVIVVIAILSALAVVSLNSVITSGKKGLYNNYEKTLEGAARNYYIDNISDIPSVGSSTRITYEILLGGKYIDKFDDPNGGDCSSSYVEVARGADNGNNFNLKYKACVVCTNKDNKSDIIFITDNC